MLMVANDLEWNLPDFDANQDSDISSEEVKALLEQSPEAKEAVDLAEVETLEAAAELARNIDTTEKLSWIDQKTIQYLATKILKLTWGEVSDGSIDGAIWPNSIKDINAATGLTIESKDDILTNVIQSLTTKAWELVTTKRAEFALAATEAAKEKEDALTLVSQYPSVEEIQALDEDAKKAVQEALQTLWYYTKAIDGDFGRGSIAAYNAAQDEVQTFKLESAESNLGQAQMIANQAESSDLDADFELKARMISLQEAEEALEKANEALRLANLAVSAAETLDDEAYVKYRSALDAFDEAEQKAQNAENGLDMALDSLASSQTGVDDLVARSDIDAANMRVHEASDIVAQAREILRIADEASTNTEWNLETAFQEVRDLETDFVNAGTDVIEAETAFSNAQREAEDTQERLDEANAELTEIEENFESIQQEIADKATVYSKLEMSDDPTAQELKDLLKQDPEGKLLLCQLQADMKILKDEDGNTLYTGPIDGHKGIDYAFGPGTAGAVTKALEMYGSITAIRRAVRIAEVTKEAEINNSDGRTNQGLDIVAQTEWYESWDFEAFLAEYKVTANMPDSLKIKPDMSPSERDDLQAQQQAWVISQAIAMWDREDANHDRRLTFIDGLANAWNDRIFEFRDLRENFETVSGKQDLTQAMMNGVDVTSVDFVNGEVGSDNYEAFILGNKIIDTGLLDSAYIACNNELTQDIDGTSQRGTCEVPIWNPDGTMNEKFAEIEFSNATYINGAIVMTVKNGCEWNLVIIPVQRDKYVPPIVPRVTHTPRITTTTTTEIITTTDDPTPEVPTLTPRQWTECDKDTDMLITYRTDQTVPGPHWIKGQYTTTVVRSVPASCNNWGSSNGTVTTITGTEWVGLVTGVTWVVRPDSGNTTSGTNTWLVID